MHCYLIECTENPKKVAILSFKVKKSVGTINCLAKSYGVTLDSSMLEMAYRIDSRPQNFVQVSIEVKYEKNNDFIN